MKTNCLTTIFDQKHFIYHCLEDNPAKTSYLIKFNLQTCNTDFIIENSYIDNKMMYIYAIFPVKVPINKRNSIAIYIALLNNNLSYGCWELNMNDGTLRFRISYLYDNNASDFERIFIDNLEHAIQYTDLCSHSLLSVMFSDLNPHEAFYSMTQAVDVMLN